MRTKIIAFIGWIVCFLGVQVVFSGPNIHYTEPLPAAGRLQSQLNGWTTPPSYRTKDIITPEYIPEYVGSTTPQGCKRIRTGTVPHIYFIPTRSLPEWTSFKNFLPHPSITIQNCPVDAVCGASGNTCQAGTPTGYSAPSCGGLQRWTCQGLNGGSNQSCSAVNTPCPTCNPSGRSCYNGNRENYTQRACSEQDTWTCRGGRLNTDTVSCSATNPPCNCEGTWRYSGSHQGCGGMIEYDEYRYHITQYPSPGGIACSFPNGATQNRNPRIGNVPDQRGFFVAKPGYGCAHHQISPGVYTDGLTEWYCSAFRSPSGGGWVVFEPNSCSVAGISVSVTCWHRCVNH